ncbi:D-alanine--D-alanine ligase family protein [Anaeromicropila populeti]|uniref:D-alanine--D-alanine ligase n=1 Tax=Anaeromicropila populeti TaxID=37658 RepID=A0A1I6KKQ2_9FIRM|nr:D-alanine--D-alanine ligase family protein [Anaeromicropila populeti]SFR91835.1 D-alanine-D-alanine ligase [Anaeromicropila populeti]
MKIKIGVFFGGQSVEHEVSIISGIQAVHAFNREKYDIIPVYITKENEMYIGNSISDIKAYRNIPSLLRKSQRIVLVNEEGRVGLVKYPMKKFGNNTYDWIDVAFPIVHGTNVEDGTLQGCLRMLCIPYIGPDVTSSAIGMDKYVMKTVLKDNQIPVLDCCVFDTKKYEKDTAGVIKQIEERFQYPVIVKPINLGSSVGIKIARDSESLQEAMDHAFEFAMKVLVEKAVTNLKEINCSVLGDYESAEASECEEPVNSDEILSYEDKYMSGGGKTGGSKDGGSKSSGMSSLTRKLPADILPEVREKIRKLAVDTFQVLNCNGVARIDFMMDTVTQEIWVNEINTIPGSLAFYLWEPLGVSYEELLDRMIQLALKRDRELNNISYSFETNLLAGVKLGGTKGGKKV